MAKYVDFTVIFGKLKNLIKIGWLSKNEKDDTIYPQALCSYSGKNTRVTRLSPYGLCSQPPEGSLAVMLSNGSQESVKFAIIDDMVNRFKPLEKGEVCIYNYMTKSYLLFNKDGDIHMVCMKDNIIQIVGNMEATVQGDLTATVTGALTADAASAAITASTITLNGDVTVNGSFTQSGGSSSSFSGGLDINGITFSTHVHTGVQTGSNNTGGPV